MTDVDVKCVPDDIGKDTQQNKADHGMILPLLSDYSETGPNAKIDKQGRYFFLASQNTSDHTAFLKSLV